MDSYVGWKTLADVGIFTKNFRYLKWRNPDPYKAILGGGLSLT